MEQTPENTVKIIIGCLSMAASPDRYAADSARPGAGPPAGAALFSGSAASGRIELTEMGATMLPALEGFTSWIRENWPQIEANRVAYDEAEQ